ncbi:hypothetical protein BH581_02980 [Vibrio splendidus]|uniref:Uncharacterized protein n=1 Tax=Vibrio splendidus TaxID=29497 RepID=A0A0H3ZL19_VIBSP|nr:hypothetical protein [Vibrio splendidus]AKN36715.1 hypothetical protein [Vibrio splendidus]OMO22822.1 hypothetical protein BH581_02980 [Vibrio splendidus]
MKWIIGGLLSVLVSLPAMAQPWHKSPTLEQLIVKLNTKYQSDDLSEYTLEKMEQVDNLSYFIRYLDQPGTEQHAKLKAFLWGMQAAHIGSINQQIQTNVVPWFCPAGGSLKTVSHNAKNPTEFIENIIWYGLEQDLKFKPNRFNAYDGAASFMSSTALIEYGLQTKYPCYDQVPQSHRLVGFNY